MSNTGRSAKNSPSIVVEDASLRLLMGSSVSSIKSVALERIAKILGRETPTPAPHEVWPLVDINLKLSQGDRLGVVGRNGAGKTTLLRVLSGIYPPTRGSVARSGSIAPVLQLGLGFNPELTGRENVYLSAAIAGMSRGQIRGKLDAIFSFAGVEDYIDAPLKCYSTGMYARLAFAVATELETDILLLDEVFAVGDIHWVERAVDRVQQLIDRVGILVLVSHDLNLIERICNRAILLEGQSILLDGSVTEVVERYRVGG